MSIIWEAIRKLDMVVSLQQDQKQQLALNSQILQSLDVLRLPLLELREKLMQHIYENPLLLLENKDDVCSPLAKKENDGELQKRLVDIHSAPLGPLIFSIHDIWRSAPLSRDVETLCAHPWRSYTDELLEQIGFLSLDESTSALCRYIIECLTPRGYLDIDTMDIARELNRPHGDVMHALYVVQGLQPVGTGARSLEECLTLQLIQNGQMDALVLKMVKQGLPLLADDDMVAITRLLACDMRKAEQICHTVRALNPIPSRGFPGNGTCVPIIPDAVITEENSSFSIVVNESTIPHLEIDKRQFDAFSQTGDPETQKYIGDKLRDANGLIKSVQDRQKTLSRILELVVQLQPEYFRSGYGLRPMTLAEIAQNLELHISTISRAVQGKYIVCAAGTVELRSLFSIGISTGQEEPVSVEYVCRQIKRHIDREDPATPLSDEKLCLLLNALGIGIARRTVAKYREEIGIPASKKRKRPV